MRLQTPVDGQVYLQILDKSWGDGIFVDLLDQDIPDRSVLKAVEIKVSQFKYFKETS